MMQFSRNLPERPFLEQYRKSRQAAPFTYEEAYVGATANSVAPVDYDHDFNQVELGSGAACFEQAKAALKGWAMFPNGWTRLYPKAVPIDKDLVVLVLFRLFGFWWANSCRIVYTFDESSRFGFAYGTLPGHVEQGEERFWVEMDEEDAVWYRIRAFSRPAIWLTKIGYPVARHFQRRFVQDSLAAMQEFVQQPGS